MLKFLSQANVELAASTLLSQIELSTLLSLLVENDFDAPKVLDKLFSSAFGRQLLKSPEARFLFSANSRLCLHLSAWIISRSRLHIFTEFGATIHIAAMSPFFARPSRLLFLGMKPQQEMDDCYSFLFVNNSSDLPFLSRSPRCVLVRACFCAARISLHSFASWSCRHQPASCSDCL